MVFLKKVLSEKLETKGHILYDSIYMKYVYRMGNSMETNQIN